MKLVFLSVVLSFLCLLQANKGEICYTITLWIGNGVNTIHSIELKSEDGIFFHEAMDQAAALDSNFTFETIENEDFGAFVTKIAGVESKVKA